MVRESLFEEVTLPLKAEHRKEFILQNGGAGIGGRGNISHKIDQFSLPPMMHHSSSYSTFSPTLHTPWLFKYFHD